MFTCRKRLWLSRSRVDFVTSGHVTTISGFDLNSKLGPMDGSNNITCLSIMSIKYICMYVCMYVCIYVWTVHSGVVVWCGQVRSGQSNKLCLTHDEFPHGGRTFPPPDISSQDTTFPRHSISESWTKNWSCTAISWGTSKYILSAAILHFWLPVSSGSVTDDTIGMYTSKTWGWRSKLCF